MLDNGASWRTEEKDVVTIPLKDLVLGGKFGQLNAVKKAGTFFTMNGLSGGEVDVDCIFKGQRTIVRFALTHIDAEKWAMAVTEKLGEEKLWLQLAKANEGWLIGSAESLLVAQ